MAQALRFIGPMRKHAKEFPAHAVEALLAAVITHVPITSRLHTALTDVLHTFSSQPEVQSEKEDKRNILKSTEKKHSITSSPECEIFVAIAVLLMLIDMGKAVEVSGHDARFATAFATVELLSKM